MTALMPFALFGLFIVFGLAYCLAIEKDNIEPPKGPLSGPYC